MHSRILILMAGPGVFGAGPLLAARGLLILTEWAKLWQFLFCLPLTWELARWLVCSQESAAWVRLAELQPLSREAWEVEAHLLKEEPEVWVLLSLGPSVVSEHWAGKKETLPEVSEQMAASVAREVSERRTWDSVERLRRLLAREQRAQAWWEVPRIWEQSVLVAPEAEQGWLKSAEWTWSVAGWEKLAEVRSRELAPLLEWVLALKEQP